MKWDMVWRYWLGFHKFYLHSGNRCCLYVYPWQLGRPFVSAGLVGPTRRSVVLWDAHRPSSLLVLGFGLILAEVFVVRICLVLLCRWSCGLVYGG